jgi:hypothetical protein
MLPASARRPRGLRPSSRLPKPFFLEPGYGRAGFGEVRQREAVSTRQGLQGTRLGTAWHGQAVVVRLGVARQRQAMRGTAVVVRHGLAMHRRARRGKAGMVRYGGATRGGARPGRAMLKSGAGGPAGERRTPGGHLAIFLIDVAGVLSLLLQGGAVWHLWV